ncbi:hypothetical protein AX16_007923 [Volvariella volvacea WC 439]|nr:hypothetical protein AX16_007923 [Volvariella volvacea WC 439]
MSTRTPANDILQITCDLTTLLTDQDTTTYDYLDHITEQHPGNTPFCNIACTLAKLHYAYQCIEEHLSLMQVFVDDLEVTTNATARVIQHIL